MVSSPKDQKQGNNTEKQANPISIHNQLDYRHKQQSAHQEHNAIHSASSRSIVSHVDVQHPSGWLNQSILIGTFENQSRHKLSPHFALFLASLVINRILEIDAAVGLLDFTDSADAELAQILITDFHTSCQHIHHHVDLHCQLEE